MKKTRARRYKEPSAASLRAIPPLDLATATSRPNPFIGRLATEARTRRGRPKRGTETGGSTTRGIRFSDSAWERLKQCAEAEGVSLHAYLRAAVAAAEARSR